MRTEEEMLAVVRTKAAALRRRQRLLVTTGAVVAVAALAGTLVLTRDTSPNRQQVTIASSTGSSTTSTTSSTTTVPVPETTTTAGTTVGSTAPATSVWADLGLRASIEFDKPVFDLTEPITYVVHVHADEGVVSDAAPDDLVVLRGCAPDGTAVNSAPVDLTLAGSAGIPTHPGRQYISTDVTVASCHDGRAVWQEASVEDAVGAIPLHNGPALPELLLARWYPGDNDLVDPYTQQPVHRSAWLELISHDRDGFAASYLIDWGDGTGQQAFAHGNPRNSATCRSAADQDVVPYVPGGLISEADPTISYDAASPAQHEYTAAGTYTITVTVISTNCDGGEAQSATSTITGTVPPDALAP